MRIAVLILVACACGGPGDAAKAGERSVEAGVQCRAGASTSGYDMWQPGDRCAKLDELWRSLPATARACASDDECGLVTGPCFAEALRVDAIERGYGESPCVHPAGGMCPPSEHARAACVNGCCTPAGDLGAE